jgi:chorismate synthase
MDLREYFGSISGHGVLASADKEGRVDVAIYSRPYVIDDTMVAFIMADHLTRRNLLSNPSAA